MADTQALQFHCTTCPSECLLDVAIEKDGDVTRVLSVHGNRCQRGAAFAEQETTCPMRILATTVAAAGSHQGGHPARTSHAGHGAAARHASGSAGTHGRCGGARYPGQRRRRGCVPRYRLRALGPCHRSQPRPHRCRTHQWHQKWSKVIPMF